jgi:hypothetical protein
MPLSSLSARLVSCTSAAATGWIFVKFDIGDFTKLCRETPGFVQIGQTYRVTLRENLGTLTLLAAVRNVCILTFT